MGVGRKERMPMQQVQLTEELYQEARRRACEAGFTTVDEYVAEVVSHDLHDEPENLDHLFTPERLAHIDEAEAQIQAGNYLTSEQLDKELAKQRAEWLRKDAP